MERNMIHLHFRKVALWAVVHLTLLTRLVNHQSLPIFCIQLRILAKIKSNSLKSLKKVSYKKIQQIKIIRKLTLIIIKIKKSTRISNT